MDGHTHAHTHVHTCAHTHAHTHTQRAIAMFICVPSFVLSFRCCVLFEFVTAVTVAASVGDPAYLPVSSHPLSFLVLCFVLMLFTPCLRHHNSHTDNNMNNTIKDIKLILQRVQGAPLRKENVFGTTKLSDRDTAGQEKETTTKTPQKTLKPKLSDAQGGK